MAEHRVLVGVMGPGDGATDADCTNAYDLGRAIATNGWVLITGGRNEGVMDAASRGAKEAGGLTIGILPSANAVNVSSFVDVPIFTGLGQARNNINVLSSQVVFACGMSPGTASEVCLALKAERHVILLDPRTESAQFFAALDPLRTHAAPDVGAAVRIAKELLSKQVEQSR